MPPQAPSTGSRISAISGHSSLLGSLSSLGSQTIGGAPCTPPGGDELGAGAAGQPGPGSVDAVDADTEMAPWFLGAVTPGELDEAVRELRLKGSVGNFVVHEPVAALGQPSGGTRRFRLDVVVSPASERDGGDGDGDGGELFELSIEQTPGGYALAPAGGEPGLLDPPGGATEPPRRRSDSSLAAASAPAALDTAAAPKVPGAGAPRDAAGTVPDGERFETIEQLVERLSRQPTRLLPVLLDGDAEYLSVFASALGRRTTSRRARASTAKPGRAGAAPAAAVAARPGSREPAAGAKGAAATPPPRAARAAADLSHLGPAPAADLGHRSGLAALVDAESTRSCWFLSGTSRDAVRWVVRALLHRGEIGDFVVRDKRAVAGLSGAALAQVLALNVKTGPAEMQCYLIERTKKRFYIRGTESDPAARFASLASLVQYYSAESRPALGVKLRCPDQSYVLEAIAAAEAAAVAGAGPSYEDLVAAEHAGGPPRLEAGAARYSSTGLPGWLKTDQALKDAVPGELRARAGATAGGNLGEEEARDVAEADAAAEPVCPVFEEANFTLDTSGLSIRMSSVRRSNPIAALG